jgi:hypothetical protein
MMMMMMIEDDDFIRHHMFRGERLQRELAQLFWRR